MKIWVTRYALSKGIYEADAETTNFKDTVRVIKDKDGNALFFPHLLTKNSWHNNKEDAIKRAKEMRSKAIESTEKRLVALRLMKFE